MKVSLLMLVLCFWSSEGSEDCTDSQKINLTHNIKNLTCMIEGELMVTCTTSNNGETKRHSNFSMVTVFCTPSGIKDEEPIQTDETKNTVMTSIQTTDTDAMTTTQVMSNCKCPMAGSAASIGLGALVGLLVVLLALVTTGWIWTCWTVKRRARITTNSSDNTVNLSSNPSYRAGYQQTLQDHQLPTPTPTYETIPALTNTMDGIKLDLAEREGDVADDSNNREDTYHKLNRAQRDDKTREIKDQTHRSGQTQGKERVTGSSSGTGLLEIQQSYATTSTECLLPNSAVSSEEEERSASIGERSLEKDTENSAKNNKELDGSALEHNGYHGPAESVENEQDLPRKRATPRDYEQAVPSKN